MSRSTVFISYAREDRAAARRLFADLRREGLDPWMDQESLLPGQRWKDAIRRAIGDSEYFIALLSSRSVSKRGYVQREFKEALGVLGEIPTGDIYVIPMRLDECEPLDEELRELHRVDMFPSWREGLAKTLAVFGIERGDQVDRETATPTFRVATFNLENFDDDLYGPGLDERLNVLRPQLFRLRADVLCLQEINAQSAAPDGHPRTLAALERLMEGTPYADYNLVHTTTSTGQPYVQRNLVVLSRFEVVDYQQLRNDLIGEVHYRARSELPVSEVSRSIGWERPAQYVRLRVDDQTEMHVINIHLKSRIPTSIQGQRTDNYTWRTFLGVGEGLFYSLIKRSGQALEVRALLDSLFDERKRPLIAVCGSYSADSEDPAMQIILGDPSMVDREPSGRKNLTLARSGISDSSSYTLIHRGRGVMMDHVAISEGLLNRYRYTEVHNEDLDDESIAGLGRSRPESDHAPVVAEFTHRSEDA